MQNDRGACFSFLFSILKAQLERPNFLVKQTDKAQRTVYNDATVGRPPHQNNRDAASHAIFALSLLRAKEVRGRVSLDPRETGTNTSLDSHLCHQ